MAILYSNTGSPDSYSGSNSFFITVSPPGGTDSAIITSVTLSFHEANGLPYGPGRMQCLIRLVTESMSDPITTAPFTFDVADKIKTFVFPSIVAKIDGSNNIEFSIGAPGLGDPQWPAPYWSIYKNTVGGILYIEIEGSWGSVPTKATNPAPANDATGVDFSGLQLSWVDGGGADTYDVYIGTTGGLTPVSIGQAGTTYTTTVEELEAIFGVSPIDQKIYWRIDSNNESGTTTGDEWNFDSRPIKATNPSPSDSATSIDFSALGLSWSDGGNADTFDVYMGPSGDLSLISSAQAGTTFTVDTADVPWGQTIYWRIDSTNAQGTTTGDIWSFDTVVIRSVKLGANGAFIVIAAKDGVYLSTDSGANWTKKLPDGVGATNWAKGICSSDGTYIIVVSDTNAIYRSANSGTSWGAITPAGGDTFSINKMATSDDGQFMVIVGQNSTDPTESCYISADYGVTWTTKKPVAASITWTDCDISNDGAIIAVSRSSYFYISFDSGTDWTEQGMASTAEVWEGLSISGDGAVGLVANTNDNDEFFIGTYTELFSEATWAETSITSAGRALLDDADAAAQAATLGLGVGDSPVWTGASLTGLTDDSVLFIDNSGVVSENNTNFNWNDFSGRLDITSIFRLKNSSGDVIFYVDDDEMYFTALISIPIEAGMPIGLLLGLTYASP